MNEQLALGGGTNITPSRRRRDLLFEAVIACYRLDAAQLTKTERDRINAKLAELRRVDAQPAEIARRRANYQARFPHAADTFPALVSHWSECSTVPDAAPGQTLGAIARLARGD